MTKVDELLVPDDRTPVGDLRPRAALVTLGRGGAVLFSIWTVVGLLYMWLLDDGPVGDAERSANRWLEARRTPVRDDVSHIASMLSDSITKVVGVVVVGAVMYWLWRRWLEPAILLVSVLFQATIFVVSSLIVGRDRPPVEQIDAAAPSGSFPSGHSAAAVVFYGTIWTIVRWHTDNRLVRAVFGVIAVVAALSVAASRTYRGMHHPIDVVAGLVLGLAAIFVVRATISEYLRDAGGPPWDRRPPRVGGPLGVRGNVSP